MLSNNLSCRTWLIGIVACVVVAVSETSAQSFQNGQTVVSGARNVSGANGAVVLFTGGAMTAELTTGPTSFGDAAFGPDGYLYVASATGIRRMDATGAVSRVIGNMFYTSFAFRQNGELIAVAGGRVDRFDLNGTLVGTLFLDTAARAADLGADQCTLYYTEVGTTEVRRFNLCTPGTSSGFAILPAPGAEIRVLADGRSLVSVLPSGGGSGSTVLLSATGAIVQTYSHYTAFGLDPDRQTFWATASGGALVRIRLDTGELIAGPTATTLAVGAGVAVVGEPRAALAATASANVPVASGELLAMFCVLLAVIAVWQMRHGTGT